MSEQYEQKEFTDLFEFLESIENNYSIKLMKKERDKMRAVITKLASIAPESKVDTERFIAKSLVREELLDMLFTINGP
jgi:hypothetical protein